MELFGLKDKDGKEYTLVVPLFANATKEVFAFCDEPKQEFRVGQWCYYDNPKGKGIPFVFRIEEVSNDGTDLLRKSVDLTFTNGIEWLPYRHCRHATPQEIEQHLRKICDEKGYKKGTKIKCVMFPEREIFELSGEFQYWLEYDRLVDIATNNSSYVPAIYNEGKFAEIIPPKKPLPKTRDEYMKFINLARNWMTKNKEEFLDQYEFSD